MFKPSPVLSARLRLTTKQVNGGYYKGTRTGSMGAHTEYGNYIIDYRKTRHYNMPNLEKFTLTPFITKEMERKKWEKARPDGTTYDPPKVDGMEMLRVWKEKIPDQYEFMLQYQAEGQQQDSEPQAQAQPQQQILADQPTQIHSASRKSFEEPRRQQKVSGGSSRR